MSGRWEVTDLMREALLMVPPVQDFKIGPDNIFVHEGYRKKLRSNDNDIALIRLLRKPELNLGVQLLVFHF